MWQVYVCEKLHTYRKLPIHGAHVEKLHTYRKLPIRGRCMCVKSCTRIGSLLYVALV
jgi:hypothetical protein